MRKESQHCQFSDYVPRGIAQQCQETTKRYKRLNQIKSKNDFLDWLRSLPLQIRYLAVKVEAPGLAQITRQTLRRLEIKNDPDNKRFTHKYPKNILDSIVFTSDGKQFFDSICFDFSYIEFPQRLYELLMYSGQNIKKFNPIQDMQRHRKTISESCSQIKHIKSKDQLCKTLVRILRHQIFFNTCHKEEIQITDQKNRKKELSFYWKNLTEELKLNLLYLKKKDLKSLSIFLMDLKIQLAIDQLEREIAYLMKLEKNQFCNRIFKCKLRKSLTPITDYHELVYRLWKSQYQKIKKRKPKRSFYMVPHKNEQLGLQKQIMKQRQERKSRTIMRNRSLLPTQKQNSIDSFQTNETQVYQKLEETVGVKSLLKQSYLNEFIEKKFVCDIKEFINFVANEANTYHNARVVAFERIRFILECYGIPIKLFGSCANGIAIKNSDIDIAIDNSIVNYFTYCEDSMKVSFSLEWLAAIFSGFKCIKNIKLIKTASIPIIKLTLDTSEPFEINQSYLNFDITPQMKLLNRLHNYSQIKVDITVQTHSQTMKCNHLGINTTKRINQWLQQFPTIKPIILILKYFLSIHELNSTYNDGINTYAMIIIIVAIIKHLKLQKQENVVKVLETVLKYIIEEFDQKSQGIDLRNKKNVFYKKVELQQNAIKADLQILDPENNGKNMTKKCYKYQFIKDLFSMILKRCFEDQRKSIILSFLKDKKLSLARIENEENMKKISLERITNGMQNPFISLVKEHEEMNLKLQKQHQIIKKQMSHKIEQKCEGKQSEIELDILGYCKKTILLKTASMMNV